ncbi:MAG: putative bifunctional diguanylate cyclase/phosphodiesterase [Hyphomicrobiaceae bacterium]
MRAKLAEIWKLTHRIDTAIMRLWPYALIGLATVLAAQIAAELDAFEMIYDFSRAHEDWELDELITLALMSVVGLLAMLVVRARQLAREISLRKEMERQADQLARHDPLTGIANRRNFNEKSEALIELAARSGKQVSLLSIDLDRFKPVNDIYGHSYGDRTLQIVTDKILDNLRASDVAARVGGDEFAAVILHEPGEPIAESISRRILNAIGEPIALDDKVVNISASIGIANFPNDADDFDDLTSKADLAMYRAKKLGRDMYSNYDPEIGNLQRERNELEAELRNAINSGEVVPYLQPLVSLKDNGLAGFEILSRWQHPSKGLIPPDRFIPIAEDCGLIGQLMQSVLRQACEAISSWPGDFILSVNLSPSQIRDRLLSDKIRVICEDTGFPCERLEIEITEAVFIEDSDLAREAIEKLKSLGMTVALDDFGTGFSSMRYLSEFPIDKVKVDKSFVLHRTENEKNEKIINSIISLGRSLGLLTTAEGIESKSDAAWLVGQGCEQGQGYLYSPPVSILSALKFAEAERDRQAAKKQGSDKNSDKLPVAS